MDMDMVVQDFMVADGVEITFSIIQLSCMSTEM